MNYFNSELAHYGVKGQRWGVIRDGLKGTSEILDKSSRLGTGAKSKSTKKDYSNISDDELKKRVARLNLEKQYGDLSGDSKKIRSGADWVHETLQDSAIIVGIASTAIGIYLAFKKIKPGV
jgi:hypothetical protein